jgi:hypothetical protein
LKHLKELILTAYLIQTPYPKNKDYTQKMFDPFEI